MKQCILCNRADFIYVTSIKKTDIFECPYCELGVTNKVTGTKKSLYGNSKFYSISAAKKRINVYIEKYERVIERLRMFVSDGNVLDVGGGLGLFSALLSSQKNLKITMLEPYLKPAFLNNINKVKVIKKNFLKFRGKKGAYSMVTLLDVLEHFRDPLEALEKVNHLLKPHGYIVILLPNYKSTMAALSNNWPWWMVEDHYFHFSRQSIKKILSKSRFELVFLESFENANDFWLSLQGNYSGIKNSVLRKLAKALTLVPVFIIYLALRPLLWRLYNGGLLLAIAQKK